MSRIQILIDCLLGLGVLSAVISSIAALVMKDLYERVHYLAPPASVSIACFTFAVLADKHLSQAGVKPILIMLVMLIANAVLTHTTARAARIRQFKKWIADVTELRGAADASTAGLNSRCVVGSSQEE